MGGACGKSVLLRKAASFAVGEGLMMTSNSDYQFDIEVFSLENLSRVTGWMTAKGRGLFWEYFDPDDLANEAIQRVDDYVKKNAGSSGDAILIKRVLWDIVHCIWVREVRREKQETSLVGSGSTCESLHSELIYQIPDRKDGSEVAMQELLADIKLQLSPRQNEIVRMLVGKEKLLDVALAIGVCKSTIDKEIAIIKKVLGPRLGQRTTNNEQRTTNNEQRTTNNEQRTTNNEILTRIEKIVSLFLKIHYAFHPILAALLVEGFVQLVVQKFDLCNWQKKWQ